jgi:hypothetical protein
MTRFIEDFHPPLKEDGINTAKNIATSANLTVGGTAAITGATTFTTAPTGPATSATSSSAAAGATVVLTAADSGKVLINKSTSGSPSWTLPAPVDGLKFTFVCGNTTAGFTVTSAAAVIHFKTSASGTVLTSTTTLTNTQGTAIVGDTISIVCDGTAWWMTAISGIFAAS